MLLAVVFASLGQWQRHRAVEKAVLEKKFLNAGDVPLEQALRMDLRFAHVSAKGHYDQKRHILLDNQVYHGQVGVHVYTPFYLADGKAILINRGWLPLAANRKKLPPVPTPAGPLVVRGRLNTAPVPGRRLGPADKLERNHWPQLVTYLDIADISRAIGTPLDPHVVQLASSEPSGFSGRDWKPAYLTAARHRAYAFQWFSLAAACIVMWLFTGLRGADKGSSIP
jgi:surfeit locus 1 family protein